MMFLELWRAPRRTFAAEGEGEGAGAGAGDQAAVAAAAAAAAAANAGAGEGAGAGAKWWEDAKFSDDQRQFLTVKGLTVDDPNEAVQKLIGIGQNADRRFGKPLDSVIDKPKEGQTVTDWMREQKDLFGLPAAAEDYKIERPKELSEGIAWDKDFEGAARGKAFELGLTPAQLQGMTGLYAEKVQSIQQAAADMDAAANTAMMADLTKDWGAQTNAKMTLARQAAGVVAEKAGLDTAALEGISGLLTTKAGGDAATIRLFAALGEMMSEDKAVGMGDGGSLGMTPADARAKAAQMRAPGGAYFEAAKVQNRDELRRLTPEMQRLDKLAVGG